MTVSRALRGDPKVKPKTRERILKTAAELGWRPNALVSSLMAHIAGARPLSDCPTLVFTLYHDRQIDYRNYRTKLTNGYYVGAKQRAKEQGFNLEYIQMNQHGMSAGRFSSVLKARNIAGLIVSPGSVPTLSAELDWNEIAAVAIGYSLVSPALHRVCLDYHRGMMTCLDILWERGWRRFGLYLSFWTDVRVMHLWSSAFLVFHWKKSILAPDNIYNPLKINKHDLTQWLDRVRPEIFFIHRNNEIRQLIREAEQALGIPPCKLIHLDRDCIPDSENRDYYASVEQNREVMGATVLDMLAGQIKRNERGIPAIQQTCLIMPEIVFHHD